VPSTSEASTVVRLRCCLRQNRTHFSVMSESFTTKSANRIALRSRRYVRQFLCLIRQYLSVNLNNLLRRIFRPDREVFTRVSTQAKARAARGRHADTAPKSVFAGLLRCARCDGSVVRVNNGDYAYLVCSKAHARSGCEYVAMRYHDAEKRVPSRGW
jgi:hypothetical protein